MRTGFDEAMQLGLRCAAKGGTVVLFTASKPDDTLTFSPNDLYFNEVRLIPSYSCGPNDTREALRLVQDGVIMQFITHRFPFDQLHAAYRNAAEARDSLKTIIEFAWKTMSAPKSRLIRAQKDHGPYTWSEVECEAYKQGQVRDENSIIRQVLVGKQAEETGFHLRYFEIEPGGYSSLEKHAHAHVVIAVRGQGRVVAERSSLEMPGDLLGTSRPGPPIIF